MDVLMLLVLLMIAAKLGVVVAGIFALQPERAGCLKYISTLLNGEAMCPSAGPESYRV